MNEFYLDVNDNAAVIITDGEFSGVLARSYDEVISRADEIQSAMAHIVKIQRYKRGLWIWVFKDDYTALEGKIVAE